MATQLNLSQLRSNYTTIDEVRLSLENLEHVFRQEKDHRAVFVTAYLTMTKVLQARLGQQDSGFNDPQWVTNLGIAFGNLYRNALLNFELGDVHLVPKAWRIAFDPRAARRRLALQELTLGTNAHVNHDLPLAIDEVSPGSLGERQYQDHLEVNRVLQAATDPIQDRFHQLYSPILSIADTLLGDLDELLTAFSIRKAREKAWTAALTLHNAKNEDEAARIKATLNDESAILAQLVTRPPLVPRWILEALRFIEQKLADSSTALVS